MTCARNGTIVTPRLPAERLSASLQWSQRRRACVLHVNIMSASRPTLRRDPGYAGLTRPVKTLPAAWYFDAAHHARELRQIWYRNWLYVCRASELAAARTFRTLQIGEQSI